MQVVARITPNRPADRLSRKWPHGRRWDREGTMSSSVELRDLFQACDQHNRGYIGREEFRELCASFQIESTDADVIFADLDRDQDQRINLDDFSQGFRDFLTPTAPQPIPSSKNQRFLKRQATDVAWRRFSDRLGKENIRRFLAHSVEHLYGLYEELQQGEGTQHLVPQFESLVESLVFDACQQEQERGKFDDAIRKEREHHQEHLKLLEEELEIQVQRVAAAAKHEAESKYEIEKRNLQLKLESEITQLQAHLRLFQKVENWLNREQQQSTEARDQLEAWGQLDKASNENRHLKLSLVDAQTTLALLQTEMSQVKSHYEEKYRLLQSERDAVFDLVGHQEIVQQKLEMLHEANRSLQDTNDSLRANMDFLSPRRSPLANSFGAISRVTSKQDLRCVSPSSFNPIFQAAGMEDNILEDSGHSSLLISEFGDPRMFEMSGPPSLQNELKMINSPSSHSMNNYLQLRAAVTANQHTTEIRLDMEPTGPADRTFRVVFAGDAAVGKSSFITRLYDGLFCANTTTTLGVDYKVKTIRIDERNVAIQLWDTAGQERFRSLTQSYFRKADGVMILFDMTNERTFLSIRHWMECIRESHEKPVPLILCGTKSDLRPAAEHQGINCVTAAQAEKLATELQAHYLETSAKTGSNVFDALVTVTRQMMISQDEEVKTSALRLTNSSNRYSCCAGYSKNRKTE